MIELWIGGSIGTCTTWVRRRVIFMAVPRVCYG
jgi:hypothetical protein